MIALILVLFELQRMVWTVGGETDWRYCQKLQTAAALVETSEVYHAAEKRYEDDESTMNEFYAFWENRDGCDPEQPKE